MWQVRQERALYTEMLVEKTQELGYHTLAEEGQSGQQRQSRNAKCTRNTMYIADNLETGDYRSET